MAPDPSMADVARRAGVALGTVSNVLNSPHKVAEPTRARVLAAIAELGFVRNSSARALASGTTDLVGMVVVDLGNSLFVEMIRGAEATLALSSLKTLVANSDVEQGKQDGYLRTFDEARVAGVLLAPLDGPLDGAHLLQNRGRPVVLLNTPEARTTLCSVMVDEEKGGYLAASHLISQGARRLGFVGGLFSLHAVAQRLAGVRRAVRTSGARLGVVETKRMRISEGRAAAAELITNDPALDGVVCTSDLLAVGVIEAVVGTGRQVPGDLMVVGYDDNHFASDSAVPISSVRQPAWEMGAAAARMLIEEIKDDQHEHRSEVLEPSLVLRASSRRHDW